MTKEQTAVEWIADRFRQYQIEGYKCNWDEVIQTVLLAKEIEDKELSKEREKAKKLAEALEHLKFGIDVAASQNANYVIETADIELIKQSLTEYEKL